MKQNLVRLYQLYGTTIVAGSFLGIGFVVPELWWLSIGGLVWWIFLITNAETRSQAAYRGVLSLWVLNMWAFAWSTSVPPIDWLPVADNTVWFLVLLFWLTSALWPALAGPFLALAIYEMYQRFSVWVVACVFPFAWVIAEVVGSFLFSVFFFGPGATLNSNMSIGYLGYHLAQHPSLFHVSAWGGVYSLSVTLVAIASTIWLLWFLPIASNTKKYVTGGMIVLLLLSFSPRLAMYWAPDIVSPEQSAIVLETAFVNQMHEDFLPPEERHSFFVDVFEQITITDIDYIILPEDARFSAGLDSGLLGAVQLRMVFGTSSKATLIDSGRVEQNEQTVLRSEIIELSDLRRTKLDKQYLVPQGEFMPQLYATLFRGLGLGSHIAEIEQTLAYQPGPYHDQLQLDTSMPRILFCFASVNPRGVRQIIGTDMSSRPLVVHPISHAWFNEPTILHQQLDTMLRVQARWNQVFILSAGNQAPSKLYTPGGAVYSSEDMEAVYKNDFITAYHFSF